MLITKTAQFPVRQSGLIVDYQELFRAGLVRTIEALGCCNRVFEACSGEDGIEIVKTQKIDMVFIDAVLPGLDGLSTAIRLKEIQRELKIVVLTDFRFGQVRHPMSTAGVSGYITKSSAATEVAEAIEAVYRGKVYFSPSLEEYNEGEAVNGVNPVCGGFDRLSRRESQVVVLLAQGYKTADVSRMLHLDSRTVSTYKRRSFEKLEIRSTAELVRLALSCGVLRSP